MKGAFSNLGKKWHGLPVWVWAVLVGLAVYLAYRWYQNRSSNSNTASTAGTTGADQSSPTGTDLGSGAGSGGGGGFPFPFIPSGGTTPNPDTQPLVSTTPPGSGVQPFTIDIIEPNPSPTQSPTITPNTTRSTPAALQPAANPGMATASNPYPSLGTPIQVSTTSGQPAAVVYDLPPTPVSEQQQTSQAGDFPSGGSYSPPAKAPVVSKTPPKPVDVPVERTTPPAKNKKGQVETLH